MRLVHSSSKLAYLKTNWKTWPTKQISRKFSISTSQTPIRIHFGKHTKEELGNIPVISSEFTAVVPRNADKYIELFCKLYSDLWTSLWIQLVPSWVNYCTPASLTFIWNSL